MNLNPLKLIVNYRLTDDALQVLGPGGVVLRQVHYVDMQEARMGYTWWNEHWENRLDVWRSAVTIRRKSGWIKNFVITPDRPGEFVAQLEERIPRHRR